MREPFTSVTQALDAVGFGRIQWLLLCYCGLAWLADACEVMLLSFLGPAIHCSWGVGPAEESLLTSVVFCGMLLGVYSLGVAADHLGRRRGFLLSAVLLGAAGLCSALAPSFGWLLLLRAVVGFALGGTPIAVTLFAEFCTTEGRGRWLLLMQSFWTLGTVMEALLAWVVLPGLGWRWLLALSALPLLALLALFPLLPESPHWLVSQRRYAEAEAVLQRVAAVNRYHKPLRLHLAPGSSASKQSLPAPLQGAGAEQVLLPSGSSPSTGARGSGSLSMRNRSLEGFGVQPGKLQASPEVPLLLSEDLAAQAPGSDHLESGSQQGDEDGGRQQQQQQQHGLHIHSHVRPSSNDIGTLHPEVGGATLLPASVAGLRQRAGRLRRLMAAAFAVVFGPQLRRTTLLLYMVWFSNASIYYGLVLLTTALQTAAKKEPCTPLGAPNLDGRDFATILITTLAECPGLLVAALLIDGPGRKRTLQAGLAVCAVALGSLVADPPRAGQLCLLFVARACIEGTFSVLYVYSPELYPTAVRSFGLALCNGFSRFGGFLAPFFTVYLVEDGHSHAAEALLCTLSAGAALCALLLPYETRGRDLQSAGVRPEGGAAAGYTGSSVAQHQHGTGGADRAIDGSSSRSSSEGQRRSRDPAGRRTSGEGQQGGAHSGGLQGVHVVSQDHITDGEVELEPAHDHHHLPEGSGEQRPLLPP